MEQKKMQKIENNDIDLLDIEKIIVVGKRIKHIVMIAKENGEL